MPPSLNSAAQKQRLIVERKQQFLQNRKHFLSRGIPPSEKLIQIARDGDVPLNQLKAALAKGTHMCRIGPPQRAGEVQSDKGQLIAI